MWIDPPGRPLQVNNDNKDTQSHGQKLDGSPGEPEHCNKAIDRSILDTYVRILSDLCLFVFIALGTYYGSI
jgi:hypothetical protein